MTAPAPTGPDDTVTLLIAGEAFSGWQDVQIVRGIELFPSHFVLRVTERLPAQAGLVAIEPGQTCQLKVGADLVLTGYIDTYEARVSTKGHEITVVGRSGTEDLVDCAAGVTSGQESASRMTFSAPTLLQLAQDLCKPLGVTVTAPDGEGPPLASISDVIPQFTIPLGATVYDVLEPYAQVRQMILTDGTDGNLVLAKVGTKAAASGFTLPGSVIEAQVGFRKQDRFTIYLPAFQAFDAAMELAGPNGTSGNYLQPVRDLGAFGGQKRPDGRERYRPHFVISPQNMNGLNLAELLAQWERARRYGRSQAVSAQVSLWRDAAGTLWTPNTLAEVDMPALKLAKLTWLITQVTLIKGLGGGTRSLVTLMPKEGFIPQPAFQRAFDPQLAQGLSQSMTAQRDGRRDQG